MATYDNYRLSVDWTLADQVETARGRVAFIPSVKLVNSSGTAIGTAGNPLVVNSSGGTASITPVVTSALATGQIIKASAGVLYGINCAATTVAGIFLIHNSATVPAAGAVTPVKAYPVGVGQGIEVSFNPPIAFSTGISISFTSAATPFTQTDSATAFIEGDAV